jgi:transcriptional regulator with XRE-family HTH domain
MSKRLIPRRIGGIYKRLREERGWSKARTARELGTTEGKYKHHENGDVSKIEPLMASAWVLRLGGPQELADEVERMARMTNQDTTRWEIGVPPWFVDFLELESAAASIDIYDAELITGLLQVPAYIEATLRVSALIQPGEADRVMAVRTKRQGAVFGRPDGPPRMRVIVNESALDRVRHEDFFGAQVDHIDELAELPGVEIHMVPTSVGLHASYINSYRIMTFEDQHDHDLVYTETPGGAQYESKRDIVARYRRVFRATLDDAVPWRAWRQRSTQ